MKSSILTLQPSLTSGSPSCQRNLAKARMIFYGAETTCVRGLIFKQFLIWVIKRIVDWLVEVIIWCARFIESL